MRVVALISGGKDSCYNMMQCVAHGHDVVALANLRPSDGDELDSYMYQTVGHHAIELYADAMSLPLYRRIISGSPIEQGSDYSETSKDEVEDLYELLKEVMSGTDVDAVSVGAILSDYQRVRVENVCLRLGLTPLAYLWHRDQQELLDEMIQCHLEAIIVKVAALGLTPKKHLGSSLGQIYPHMVDMQEKYGLNICGEGGEYETFTLDCPLFNKRVVIDDQEVVVHSDDAFAPVAFLHFRSMHLEKNNMDMEPGLAARLKDLPMKRSRALMDELCSRGSICELQDITGDSKETECCTDCTRNRLEVCHIYHSKNKSGYLWISGIVGRDIDGTTMGEQTEAALQSLQYELEKHGYSTHHLLALFLYVSSMAHFAHINSVYRRYFAFNPPVRVCVEVALPVGVALQMDCVAHRNTGDVALERHTMHVQSVSHWAPANIGPYSQAVKIDDIVYVAGQIPLCPATMTILESGPAAQSRLALRHVDRILAAMTDGRSLSDVLLAICYVSHSRYIPFAQKEWQIALTGAEKNDAELEQSCHLVEYVVVPALPRSALVEWQVYASTGAAHHNQVRVERTEVDDVTIISEVMEGQFKKLRLTFKVTAVLQTDAVDTGLTGPVEVLLDSMLEAVRQLLRRSGQTMDDLRGLRIFYLSQIFVQEDLHQAFEKSFMDKFAVDAVSSAAFIPVSGFAQQHCLLSVCQ
ncbi:Diphthine--ammonia ligase [Lamellibrachia satsuma]|nr:Diphthine--ammonia ligase [Lamellibrachia satsuma]